MGERENTKFVKRERYDSAGLVLVFHDAAHIEALTAISSPHTAPTGTAALAAWIRLRLYVLQVKDTAIHVLLPYVRI